MLGIKDRADAKEKMMIVTNTRATDDPGTADRGARVAPQPGHPGHRARGLSAQEAATRSRPILVTVRAPNAALWWVTGGTLALLGLILVVPGVRDLFGFALLHPPDVALCLAAGSVSILWFEALKVLRLSHRPHAHSTL